jgi:S1-C subfamily serine protease
MFPALQSLSDDLKALVATAAPAMVGVHSKRSRSSGFVWRPGLIVTADEALAEDSDFSLLLPGGATTKATLAGRDPTTDIALLRIDDTTLPAIPLAASQPAAGELAVVAGSQEGSVTAALGIVALSAGAWRSLRGGEIDARIELELALRRGAEGGVVLDPAGQAIGMAVFGPRRRVIVIPATTIERVAARLQSHGRIGRGYLGLALQAVSLPEGGIGAMVMGVDAGGPAVGVHQGDVFTRWNGQAIASLQTLLRSLGPDSIGTTVSVDIRRAGQPITLSLTIGERPPA